MKNRSQPGQGRSGGADHSGQADTEIVPPQRRYYPLTDAYGRPIAYICDDPAELIRIPAEAQA